MPLATLEIIIPVYNEEQCIDEFIKRIVLLKEHVNCVINCIFINDGSKDNSLNKLKTYAETNSFIKVLSLSRNFGHQIAVTAGLNHANSDYIVIIDADLQDPPELIEKMLNIAMNDNIDIVYAKRKKRDGESFFKLITAKFFYYLIQKLCKISIPEDTGDFRLINNKVLKCIQSMPEKHRFLRGMFPWIGFKSIPVEYNRDARYAGTTKYPFRKMLNFALDAIFSFSNLPLRLATYVGLWVILFGFLGMAFVLYLRLFTNLTVPGISAVIITIIVIGGIQILMLGITGEYVGRIFEESKGRPLYFLDEKINF